MPAPSLKRPSLRDELSHQSVNVLVRRVAGSHRGHFFPDAARWARVAKDPGGTWPPWVLAVAPWIRRAASAVMGRAGVLGFEGFIRVLVSAGPSSGRPRFGWIRR